MAKFPSGILFHLEPRCLWPLFCRGPSVTFVSRIVPYYVCRYCDLEVVYLFCTWHDVHGKTSFRGRNWLRFALLTFPSCPQATYQASVFWCSISPCPFWPWRFCIQSCAHVFLSREAPWDEAGQNARHAEAVKTAKKITLMIIVAVLFTLCWCPFFVFVGLNSVHKIVLQYAAFKFIVWLANAYSAINPFIYLTFDEKFGNELKIIMEKCRTKFRCWDNVLIFWDFFFEFSWFVESKPFVESLFLSLYCYLCI